MSKRRPREVRRDRRKAKASDWKRAGKIAWGKVGRGAGTAHKGLKTTGLTPKQIRRVGKIDRNPPVKPIAPLPWPSP